VFKRPSSRRRSTQDGIQINLVPMLDALMTLIAFLMFSMAFLAFVSIESPFPIASKESVKEALKKKPLQLTVTLGETETVIWSPFDKIRSRVISNLPDGVPDVIGIHTQLVEVKKKFPLERQIVLLPFPAATYDILIGVMDAVRNYDPGDDPLYAKNPLTGIDYEVTRLFPDVVFGNLLGVN